MHRHTVLRQTRVPISRQSLTNRCMSYGGHCGPKLLDWELAAASIGLKLLAHFAQKENNPTIKIRSYFIDVQLGMSLLGNKKVSWCFVSWLQSLLASELLGLKTAWFLGFKISKIQWPHITEFPFYVFRKILNTYSIFSTTIRRIFMIIRRPPFPTCSFCCWNPTFCDS